MSWSDTSAVLLVKISGIKCHYPSIIHCHMTSFFQSNLLGMIHVYFFSEVVQQKLDLYCERGCYMTLLNEVSSFVQIHRESNWIPD